MKEEIKNRIDAENKEKGKLDDAELAQVTGGTDEPWRYCDQYCLYCNVSDCPSRGQPVTSLSF